MDAGSIRQKLDEDYFKGWRAEPKLAGGGIMLDQGIHMLDLFLHFAGDFDEIYSIVSNLHWKMDGLEDNVFAIMRNTKIGISASLALNHDAMEIFIFFGGVSSKRVVDSKWFKNKLWSLWR